MNGGSYLKRFRISEFGFRNERKGRSQIRNPKSLKMGYTFVKTLKTLQRDREGCK